MTEAHSPDWDPSAPDVLADQIAADDLLRETCPVAYATTGVWAAVKHADVVCMLDAPEVYSNAVSRHVAVPNGLDPPQHTAYRAVVDSLLYGRGIHACPGAPLARLELRVIVEELVCGTKDIAPAAVGRTIRVRYPAGFSRLSPRFS
ncbi:hypothetical protein ABGB19_00120 [Mycobacterium sp. B14F4]|uniref:hypothetical protein n=1 Tax=Mycobacterium sp. B14F4 TaxID=3153565 RepID=UPI00325E7F58